MKIAIDARWIFPRISGIGSYTRELVSALAACSRHEAESFVLLFNDADVQQRIMQMPSIAAHPHMQALFVPYGVFSPWNQLRLPRLLKQMNVRVYHSTNYMIPFAAFPRNRRGTVRCAITVHDLIPLIFPHYTPRAMKTRLYPVFSRVMQEAGLRADALITPSEATQRDVLKWMRVPPSRQGDIHVVPEGVHERYQPGAPGGTDRPVVLYVGRYDPYKNVPTLIRAFARVLQQVPQATLRLVGPPDPRYPEADREIQRLGLTDRIQRSGYVTDAELLEAYQSAALLVLPSSYEGFGLPVVEAMACGTPVVCSKVSSLPEVAGDDALLIDPENTDQLADAMISVLTDTALAARLRGQGLARAAHYTWQQAAETTLGIYRKLAD